MGLIICIPHNILNINLLFKPSLRFFFLRNGPITEPWMAFHSHWCFCLSLLSLSGITRVPAIPDHSGTLTVFQIHRFRFLNKFFRIIHIIILILCLYIIKDMFVYGYVYKYILISSCLHVSDAQYN